MDTPTLWQLAQNVLAPQNIDRLGTAWDRDMLNIYVRKVSWQNLSVLRPRFNPLIHFYSKSNFPIFHQVLYRNLQIRPQKWVSHWFLTKKKKIVPKKVSICQSYPQKKKFSNFWFYFSNLRTLPEIQDLILQDCSKDCTTLVHLPELAWKKCK